MADIHLYSLATPNGQKISTFLEAAEIPYEATMINILEGDQFSEDFIKINPNAKIPAIVDKAGPDGKEIPIMESGAILLYLAEKYGKFLPEDKYQRNQVIQWLFFQVGGAGPMFGQFGHFYKYAADKCKDPYPVERYSTETKRLLQVLENQLEGQKFIVGNEASIADFSLVPWVICLDKFYEAREHLGLDEYKNVSSWVKNFFAIPGVEKGMKVCDIPT